MSPLMKTAMAAMIAALMLASSGPSPAAAQEADETFIVGHLVNGTQGASFDPTTVAVTLNVFEGVTALDPVSARPESDGSFSFPVDLSAERVYFLSAEYQGATYSATVSPDSISESVELIVYEATHDVSVLGFSSYSIIVTGAVPNEGWLEVLERASVTNESGTTLVPDFAAEGPAMLNFLRFALPDGAYNLDVSSTVVGGEVLTVDRGFAMTTPIPPTSDDPHLFEFVYRIPYDGDSLDLSRTMRFGADSLRYVVPADVGRPTAPSLTDLGATELNGRFLRLLEGQDVGAGDFLEISISELPQPSFVDQIRERGGDWYVLYLVPGLLVVAMVWFVFAMNQRRRLVPSVATSAQDPSATREHLLARLAELDSARLDGRLSPRQYEQARAQIREALIDLRLAEAVPAEAPLQRSPHP